MCPYLPMTEGRALLMKKNLKYIQNVKDLSNYRQESHGWMQCVSLEAPHKAHIRCEPLPQKVLLVEQDCWIQLNVSAAGLRTINKIGLDAALKQAAEKGYLYE